MIRRPFRVTVRFTKADYDIYTAMIGKFHNVWTWTDLVHKALHELRADHEMRQKVGQLASSGSVDVGQNGLAASDKKQASIVSPAKDRARPLMPPKPHTGKHVSQRSRGVVKRAKRKSK
jgi:hypothetical protein